jgi:putative chitinase
MITAAQVQELGLLADWLDPLNEVFARYDMATPARMASFIGQCQHESGNFKTLRENLNYSAKGLCATWPKRFPTEESATPYHRNPEKIANKVYADRMGNGDEASGDGWKYSGRGLIQLTGKSNYTLAGDSLVADLLNTPDLVLQPKYAALTAGWFWDKNRLNAFADADNIEGMTKKINGGTIGLDDRKKHIAHALEVLGT